MTGRLFCYYGDDFTGSTDALEALASNDIPTVLFLEPPSDSMLAPFPECRAIGVEVRAAVGVPNGCQHTCRPSSLG